MKRARKSKLVKRFFVTDAILTTLLVVVVVVIIIFFLAARKCYDFVEVHDGPFITNRSLGQFCGKHTPFSLNSTSNVMLVRFHSDSSVSNKGFQLVYTANSE